MKTIVKIKDLTLVCDEVYGNSIQAGLGLNYVASMPKHRGLIFYLDYPVSKMDTAQMKFPIDIFWVDVKTAIEMNRGLMKEYGIVAGDKVEIIRLLDDFSTQLFGPF